MKITSFRELMGMIGGLLVLASLFNLSATWARAFGWGLVVALAIGYILVYLNSTLIIADRTFKILGWSLVGAIIVVVIVLLELFEGS